MTISIQNIQVDDIPLCSTSTTRDCQSPQVVVFLVLTVVVKLGQQSATEDNCSINQ